MDDIPTRRVNIGDVAAQAGVSRKTVSRVINNHDYVSDAVRENVQRVVDELNYEPDRQARSLRTGRSYQIAFLYESPSSYFVISLVEGIREICRERGYELIVRETKSKGSRQVKSVMDFIGRSRLDGVILMPPLTDNEAMLAALSKADIAHARITPGIPNETPLDVHTTNRRAGREMMDYLLSLGHSYIAYICGDPDHIAMAERRQGVRDSMSEWTGRSCEFVVRQGFNTFESGQKAARHLLALDPRPTAIFAANDDMAAGVVFEAQELGLRIPKDISIVGFDNTLLAARIWPGLTTVDQSIQSLGAASAVQLIDHVTGRDIVPLDPIPTELVIRRSSGPPPEAP